MLPKTEEMQYVLSVTEVNKYIKEIVSRDLILSNLWVKGEVSNFKHHSSGHMYFSLKDSQGIIKCVMFKTHNMSLRFNLKDGMNVVARGYVSVFERDGQYQLYIEGVEPDGLGNLYLEFEELKKKLYNKGWFDESRKKMLPYLPEAIGVITSPTGSVIRDIIHVLSRRNDNFKLILYPAAVQGQNSAREVCEAIEYFNKKKSVDVIIIARGGGSLEELWSFNEEIVASSIYNSSIPIISAIGHETDYTISDYVADYRAPTPSAAAEIVLPQKEQIIIKVSEYRTRLSKAMNNWVLLRQLTIDRLLKSPVFRKPFSILDSHFMKLDYVTRSLAVNTDKLVGEVSNKLSVSIAKLDSMSPLKVLNRGYSVTRKARTNEIVTRKNQVMIEDELSIQVSDGTIKCKVNQIS